MAIFPEWRRRIGCLWGTQSAHDDAHSRRDAGRRGPWSPARNPLGAGPSLGQQSCSCARFPLQFSRFSTSLVVRAPGGFKRFPRPVSLGCSPDAALNQRRFCAIDWPITRDHSVLGHAPHARSCERTRTLALRLGPLSVTSAHMLEGRVERKHEPWLSRLVARPVFLSAVVLAIFAFSIGRALLRRLPPPLPIYEQFPAFELVDQRGQPFGSASLNGRTWLFAVVSTDSAAGEQLAEKLRTIQHRSHALGTAFQVVCVTSDPKRNTPAQLDQFVRGHHGSPRMWTFLTGDPEQVRALVGSSALPKLDSGQVVWLIDTQMRIRAAYDASDANMVDRALRDVGLLANRGE